MKLGATITSERGKPVTKTGNEYIEIKINNGYHSGIYATLYIDAGDGEIELINSKGVTVYRQNAVEFTEAKEIGNLKHGNYLFESPEMTINRIKNDNDSRYDDVI